MNNSVQPLSEVSSAVEIGNHLTLAETHAYFAQQSKNNFETDLFSNVQGTPLADSEMKVVEGDGWLEALVGGIGSGLLGGVVGLMVGGPTGAVIGAIGGAVTGALAGANSDTIKIGSSHHW